MDKLRIDFETDERLVRKIIVISPEFFFFDQLSYFIYSTGLTVDGLVNRAVVLNIGFTFVDGRQNGFRCGGQGGRSGTVHARVNSSNETVVARRRNKTVFPEIQRISTERLCQIVSVYFGAQATLLSTLSLRN